MRPAERGSARLWGYIGDETRRSRRAGLRGAVAADGHIDDRAVAAAGWRSVRRIANQVAIDRFDDEGAAVPVRYVTTEKLYETESGAPHDLQIDRSIGFPDIQPFQEQAFSDRGKIDTDVRPAAAVDAIRAALSRELRAAPQPLGELLPGGDWLLRRFDTPFVGIVGGARKTTSTCGFATAISSWR